MPGQYRCADDLIFLKVLKITTSNYLMPSVLYSGSSEIIEAGFSGVIGV